MMPGKGGMYIENRVDSRTRSMLRNGSFNVSTHMDNIKKQDSVNKDILKINKHLCTYLKSDLFLEFCFFFNRIE